MPVALWKPQLISCSELSRGANVSQFNPTPAFTHAVAFVLGKEGGYVNDPTDKGGETKYGISDKRDGVADGMTDVSGDGQPDTRIKDLTLEQASQIYFRDYWYPAYCPDWPDGISLLVFDAAVQHGVKKAISLLQSAAGVTADGIVGPKPEPPLSVPTLNGYWPASWSTAPAITPTSSSPIRPRVNTSTGGSTAWTVWRIPPGKSSADRRRSLGAKHHG